jgi:hypothetical protein
MILAAFIAGLLLGAVLMFVGIVFYGVWQEGRGRGA